MDMNLAAMYGTPGGEAASEEQEKVAQAELFAKLAADEGINLNELNDDQIQELWDHTFDGEKVASATHYDHGVSEAEVEFAVEKDFQEKTAEADYLGRVMAHSYVQELGAIGENMDKEAGRIGDAYTAVKGLAGKGRSRASAAYGKGKEHASSAYGKARDKARAASGKAGAHLESVGGKAQDKFNRIGKRERGVPMTSGQRKALGAGIYGAGATAAGATGYGLSKKSSAGDSLNELAFDLAIDKIAEAGWDPEECAERIGSVFTLGLFDEENTKIAAADDVYGAVEIRSLELLESAGYDVNWD